VFVQPHDLLIAPFTEFAFMRRALAGSVALAIAGPPLGVFLILRRMALIGDAAGHAILPGAALGYLAAGLSLGPMTIGGLAAGLIVAVGSGVVARTTILREDASLATFYLISLALGVTIVSLRGSNIDLLHVLFGTLVVLNLVGAFQALGTLLAVGMMMLPAASARLVTQDMTAMIGIAAAQGILAGYAGLIVSFHAGLPSGPLIILMAGLLYLLALVFGPAGGLLHRFMPGRHLEG
jgi:zinc/manganese transport system permease protein